MLLKSTAKIMNLNEKSRGLGDTIEKFTTATGIKAVVDVISEATGVDCGCDGRKEVLNQWFPYKGNSQVSKSEYNEAHKSVVNRHLPYRIKTS
jgi:hypothetical protein